MATDLVPVISQDFSRFPDFLERREVATKERKKEVACIVSKPLASWLWGCGESVNPPKLNIQEVHGVLSSRPKGDPDPPPIFQDCLLLSNQSWNFHRQVNVYLDSKRVSILLEAVLPTFPMLYLPFNVYLDSKRVSILIEAVLPALPMLYLSFNVYLDSKRVSILLEAILPTLPMLYLPFNPTP